MLRKAGSLRIIKWSEAMSSKGYWRRRALEYEREWAERCQNEIERELAKYFREALNEIADDVAALYGKYAGENGLTMTEARKLIRGDEFKTWRMSLKEYVAAAHTSSAILRELNTLSMRSRISRLEKIYSETLRELQKLGERSESAVKDFLTTAYRERYYHGIFDFAQVGKLEIPVSKVEPAKLEKVLASRWAGGNFSSRIWKNTERLSQVLKKTIMQGLHRGLSVQKMAKTISREMNSSYKNAERLVRTEMNFVQNYAARESMEAAGLREYEFIATLDNRTSQRCRALDGTVHLLEEFDPGTNAPPMHPRCRSTISAVISEETRTAKVGGRNIRVPADMTYHDYKRVFADKTLTLKNWQVAAFGTLYDGEGAGKRTGLSLRGKNLTLQEGLGKTHYSAVKSILEKAPSGNAAQVWQKFEGDIRVGDAHYQDKSHHRRGQIYIDIDAAARGNYFKPKYQTVFHEGSHDIDWLNRNKATEEYFSVRFKIGAFIQALHEDFNATIETRCAEIAKRFEQRDLQWFIDKDLLNFGKKFPDKILKATAEERERWYRNRAFYDLENELLSTPARAHWQLSDILDGITRGRLRIDGGHGKEYWEKRIKNGIECGLAKEAFADFMSAAISNVESFELLKKYLPNAAAIFEEMLEELLK